MAHESKDYSNLVGKLDGFLSQKQLEAHFGLYKGYVNKLNEIETKLAGIDPASANYSFNEFSELKRREAVAFNGAFLHEMYFENLAPAGETGSVSAELNSALEASFGSFDKFYANLKGVAMSAPGWAVLTYNKVDKKVHTYLLQEHHIGLPVHQELLVVLDSWEHAFMIDYGTARATYVDGFAKHINWNVVNERFSKI
ncbi:MAG: Fe-Mn family superoxide dismutase [Candidatus Sericytochromatia bacterium]